jgi:phosphoglycolate phosphatase-like HAD superfamily hydrolase
MPEENQAQNILNIESLINNASSHLDTLTREAQEQKSMIDALLENDAEYQEVEKEAKKQSKLKTIARQKSLNVPEAKSTLDKLKDTQIQIKEIKTAMSDYLAQYVSLSGTNQIEGPDGVLRQIIYIAKLVKSK